MSSAHSMPPPTSSGSSGSGSSDRKPLDPVFRNALRYTVSPREYEVLHKYLLSRAPATVKKRAPRPKSYLAMVQNGDGGSEYNSASVRGALRVFVAAYTGLKGWEFITNNLMKKRTAAASATAPPPPKHGNARTAASFSLILLFHRLLFRFFTRLRASLLDKSAEPFRTRNPRISHALTANFTPAVGASLAGLFLGLTPSSPLRKTIAIYVLVRSLEFSYNALEQTKLLFPSGRPSWFGSWLLMPVCYGQLLHAFIFDRDCFPSGFGDLILSRSPEYIHPRPASLSPGKPYPSTYDAVDALASLSRLHWPPFTSPILFPASLSKPAASPALAAVRPLTSPAHPLIKSTSCAILHPSDPSCARVHLKFWLRSFPPTLRLISILYSAFALLRLRKILASPLPAARALADRIVRMTLFITGGIGSAWGMICLCAAMLPRGFLPTGRFALAGAAGGSWAYVARRGERSTFLYCARLSVDSAWKVGVKHGLWRGVRGGDVLLFTAGLAAIAAAFEARPTAIEGKALRGGMRWARGEEEVVLQKQE